MLGKFLFWAIVIIAGLMAARIIARHQENSSNPDKVKRAPPAGRGKASGTPSVGDTAEAMVRCEHCGIHLPRSEAVLIGGHTWCSQEHARLGHKQ